MKNERGITLVDLLVWLALISVISVASFKIIALQVEHMQQAQYSKFYDEINSIDKYLQEFNGNSVITHGENFLELINDDRTIRLDDTGKGVVLTTSNAKTNEKVSVHYTFIKDFTVYPVETLVVKGTKNAQELLYRVPVKNTFQVFYNSEMSEDAWFKEVVTYVFE